MVGYETYDEDRAPFPVSLAMSTVWGKLRDHFLENQK